MIASLVGAPKNTRFTRYLKVFLAFLISGLQHACFDILGFDGLVLDQRGVIGTYILQSLGIMLEDAVQELYRRISGESKGPPSGDWVPLWKRLVGYCWVGLFLVWTMPGWCYQLLRPDRKIEAVAFSVVQWVGARA